MLKVSTLILAACLVGGPAAAQSAAGETGDVERIGPWPNEAHPLGGYVPVPPNSTRLVAKVFEDAAGFPLYVMDRECRGQCAVMFPPLTPAEGATPPSPEWTIRIRDENGDPQWVYKGKPVYTYIDDKPDRHPMVDNVYPGIQLAQP